MISVTVCVCVCACVRIRTNWCIEHNLHSLFGKTLKNCKITIFFVSLSLIVAKMVIKSTYICTNSDFDCQHWSYNCTDKKCAIMQNFCTISFFFLVVCLNNNNIFTAALVFLCTFDGSMIWLRFLIILHVSMILKNTVDASAWWRRLTFTA